MSVTNASVTAASFSMAITQATVSPLIIGPTISLPLTFGTSSYVNTTSGSFTPINNAVTMHTFSTVTDLPRWFFLVVDQPIQLTATISGGASPINKLPVQRFFFAGSPTPNANYNTILIDGTTASANYTMSQNVAVNFTLFWGDGSLS